MTLWAIEPQQTSSVDSPCSPIFRGRLCAPEGEDLRSPTTALDELSSVEGMRVRQVSGRDRRVASA